MEIIIIGGLSFAFGLIIGKIMTRRQDLAIVVKTLRKAETLVTNALATKDVEINKYKKELEAYQTLKNVKSNHPLGVLSFINRNEKN